MKFFFASTVILFSALAQGQNLVPNPGFENFSMCPVGFSQYTGYVNSWTNPSAASPDYYHACANPNPAGTPVNGFGFQYPRTGNAYSGFYATAGTYREFIQVQLTSALSSGSTYVFSMYVNCHNRSKWVTDDIGAYLSTTPPLSSGTGFLSGNPIPQLKNPSGNLLSDTLGWTVITGTYTATGGERYLTIGHFLDDASCTYLQVNYGTQGSYYYVDDVSLTPAVGLPVELISFQANAESGRVKIEWSTASESKNDFFEVQRSTDDHQFFSLTKIKGFGTTSSEHFYDFVDREVIPNQLYYYRLRQVDIDGQETFSSDISVKVLPFITLIMDIYPNPSNGSIEIVAAVSTIRIYNSLGQLKFTKDRPPDRFQLDVEFLGSGIYFLEGIVEDQRITKMLVIN